MDMAMRTGRKNLYIGLCRALTDPSKESVCGCPNCGNSYDAVIQSFIDDRRDVG